MFSRKFEQVYKKIISEQSWSYSEYLANDEGGYEKDWYEDEDTYKFCKTFWKIYQNNKSNYFKLLIEYVSKYVDVNKFICADFTLPEILNKDDINRLFVDIKTLQNYNVAFTNVYDVLQSEVFGTKIIIKIKDILKDPLLLGGDTYGNSNAALSIWNAIKYNEIYNSATETQIDNYVDVLDNTSPKKITSIEFKNLLLQLYKAVYNGSITNVDVNYLNSKLNQN